MTAHARARRQDPLGRSLREARPSWTSRSRSQPGDFVGVWGGSAPASRRCCASPPASKRPTPAPCASTVPTWRRCRRRGGDRCGSTRSDSCAGKGRRAREFTVARLPRPAAVQSRARAARRTPRALDLLRRVDDRGVPRRASWRTPLRRRAGARQPRARPRPRAALLLVDDPTAGLDPLQRNEVVGLLRRRRRASRSPSLMTSSAMSAICRARTRRSRSATGA